MGSNWFTEGAPGADPRAAFAQAVSESAHRYGHGGYTGSLAEKDSYVVIRGAASPMTRTAALALIATMHDDLRVRDKYGPAGAIALVDDTKRVPIDWFKAPLSVSDDDLLAAAVQHARATGKIAARTKALRFETWASQTPNGGGATLQYRGDLVVEVPTGVKKRTVTVTVPDGTWEEKFAAATAKANLKPGDKVVRQEQVSDTPGAVKVQKVSGTGKRVTRYRLKGVGQCPLLASEKEVVDWIKDLPEARAPWLGAGTYEVEAIVVREDGPLATIAVSYPRRRTEIQLDIESGEVASGLAPTSWLFFGWASD